MENLLISCLESRVEEGGIMYGRFLFGPAPRGLAVTIANTLRRSLLSNVSGFAITHVEFIGPKHEYSTLPGTQETVLDVLLNLKKLIFSSTTTVQRTVVGYCSGRGPGVLTGRDLKLPPGLQCTNPDHVIAHLADDGHLRFSFLISSGENYMIHKGVKTKSTLREERDKVILVNKVLGHRRKRQAGPGYFQGPPNGSFGEGGRQVRKPKTSIFSIDAVFMPVLRVNFLIKSDEDVLDFPLEINSLEVSERVIFEIWTNGNVTPLDAMHQASANLVRLFTLFQKPNSSMFFRPRLYKKRRQMMEKEMAYSKVHTLQAIFPNHFLDIDIGILPLSPALFCELKKRQIDRLGDFIDRSYDDLLAISGMTTEALFEILCALRAYGIRFLLVNLEGPFARLT